MLWKRSTPAAGFWGLIGGTISAAGLFFWVRLYPPALKYVAFSPHASEMAENVYRALWCLIITLLITWGLSYVTKPKPESELKNLVYGFTPIPKETTLKWFRRPVTLAYAVSAVFVVINVVLW